MLAGALAKLYLIAADTSSATALGQESTDRLPSQIRRGRDISNPTEQDEETQTLAQSHPVCKW